MLPPCGLTNFLLQAHCIKERRSNTTRAVLALQSRYKWALSGTPLLNLYRALSGTPLLNRVGELYSLVSYG